MNSKAMVKIPVLILAVLMWFQCNACAAYVVPGNTTPDDDRYLDKEVRISTSFIKLKFDQKIEMCVSLFNLCHF